MVSVPLVSVSTQITTGVQKDEPQAKWCGLALSAIKQVGCYALQTALWLPSALYQSMCCRKSAVAAPQQRISHELQAPASLPNQGNTCFIAAPFQMIANDSVLSRALERYDPSCSREERVKANRIKRCVQAYHRAQESSKVLPTSMRRMRKILHSISPGIPAGFAQGDAHEALMAMFSGFDKTSSLAVTETTQRYGKEWKYKFKIGKSKYWRSVAEQEMPAARGIEIKHPVFTVKMPVDGRDRFIDGMHLRTLLIDHHFRPVLHPHNMNTENAFRDPVSGKQYVHLREEVTLSRAPGRLVLHLGRFGMDLSKNPSSVQVPDILDLRDNGGAFSGENPLYQLQSYVVHIGTFRGGHYITHLKKMGADGKEHFYYCSDGTIREESRNHFLREANPPVGDKTVYLVNYAKVV